MVDGAAAGPWIALALLGALHGVNPGMGWLFAVALGMQQGRGRAVWRALGPLAVGHAGAIVVAVALAAAIGTALPPRALRWGVAAALLALGVRQLRRRHAHPRAGGMRVGWRALAAWSFLVASAHGAGLMAVPFAVDAGAVPPVAEAHAAPMHAASHAHGAVPGTAPGGALRLTLLATLVHTAAYLLVTGMLAVVVYERAGLRLLRRAWVNLDLLWAGALVATAAATLLP